MQYWFNRLRALIALDGKYAELFNRQAEGYLDDRATDSQFVHQ